MLHKKEIIFSALLLIYANVSTHQKNNVENEGVKKCIWLTHVFYDSEMKFKKREFVG